MWKVRLPITRIRRYKLAGLREPYRVFVVPAEIVNECRRRRLTSRQEADVLAQAEWELRLQTATADEELPAFCWCGRRLTCTHRPVRRRRPVSASEITGL
jgi:hypothetical protein